MSQKGGGLLVSILITTVIIAGVGVYELQGGIKSNNSDNSSSYQTDVSQAKGVQIQTDFKSIQTALESYRVSKGQYPDSLDQLVQSGGLASQPRNPYTNSDYDFSSDGKNYTLSTKLGDGSDYTITN